MRAEPGADGREWPRGKAGGLDSLEAAAGPGQDHADEVPLRRQRRGSEHSLQAVDARLGAGGEGEEEWQQQQQQQQEEDGEEDVVAVAELPRLGGRQPAQVCSRR